MIIVLIRHGHKGMIPFEDPSLTENGFKQAKALASLIQQKKLPTPTDLWASQKIRTSQTLSSLAEKFQLDISKKNELNLRMDNENQKNFRDRIQNLISSLSESSDSSSEKCIYLCTHYDWIEEAMSLIPSDTDLLSYQFSHWSPAQYIIFEIQEQIWKYKQKGTAEI